LIAGQDMKKYLTISIGSEEIALKGVAGINMNMV